MERAFFWILVLLLMPACNFLDGKSDTPGVNLGEPFELGLGNTAFLDNDTKITFQELKQDSRCPLKVQCIWEGEIEAIFRFESNHASDSLIFKGFLGIKGDKPLERVTGMYKISLEQMNPYPEEGKTAEKIVATLWISSLND